MPNYDVAIVGAGPAGSATALWLARAGARVLLLERSHFERPRVGESLSPDINPLLRELGVEPDGAQPSFGIRSHWGGDGSNSSVFNPYGNGWYVDRAAFDRRLAETAAAAGVDLRTKTACLHVHKSSVWTLSLTGDRTETARLLIDATGRAAGIGRRRGAERIAFDRLVAITAFVPASDPGGFGLVETVPAGWCYSAPAGAGRLVAMLLTDADLGRDASLTTPENWRSALGPETAARLADTRIPELRVVSAASQRLHRPTPDATWLAVGDAALAQDPITGTGVVRALRAAKEAADVVLDTGPRSGPIPPTPGSPERDRFTASNAADTALTAGRRSGLVPAPPGPLGRDRSEGYESALDRECTAYLWRRADFYAAENRWPTAPFWERRRRVLSAS